MWFEVEGRGEVNTQISNFWEYGIIVSLQMMSEGVDGRVFLYGRCKNRASVFPGLNSSELLDSFIYVLCLSEDIMFVDSLGLSVHDRYICMVSA